MSIRKIKQLVNSSEISEGAGVTVFRSIGTPSLRNLDPFLMLDHMGSNNPDEYLAGFPEHPHRGFITLTYMLEGHMEHRDSMGNKGQLRSGGAQWMKAASGVIHSEMPKQTEGLMSGFQLWINLPASEKMTSPEYQEFSPEAIPEVKIEGQKIRVISGSYVDANNAITTGPIVDDTTSLNYFDVSLESNQRFHHKLNSSLTGFIYVIKGETQIENQTIASHQFVALTDGESLEIKATANGAHFIFVAGKSINEPIVQRGPFVMNTREEIDQAIADYQNGTLVQERAQFTSA